MRIWIVRTLVLTSLALVSWLFGPRAYVVLAARLGGGTTNALVDLDQVAAGSAPVWLRNNPALFRSLLEELSPYLDRRVGVHDLAALERLSGEIDGLSWVDEVRIRRSDTGGFTLSLELRRPVLEVLPMGAAVDKVAPVYVSAEGICIRRGEYDLESGLPVCRMMSGPMRNSLPVYILGESHPDQRVLAAAAVAIEWRDQVLPAMAPLLAPSAKVPDLVEVDASNLHYRLVADRRMAEIRVTLRRDDGGVATLDYGHPPSSPMPRVAIADRVRVLASVLKAHPGLRGVVRADLRFVNMWQTWVRTESQPGAPFAVKR